MRLTIFLIYLLLFPFTSQAIVELGVDLLFKDNNQRLLKGKKIGLITNQTGYTSQMEATIDLLDKNEKDFSLIALFCPEHGLNGTSYADESINHSTHKGKIPIFSLHGDHRRPTDEMLKDITLLIFDIQDIGSRTYTYSTTLFYLIEEAAKRKIPLIVLDRPNPINGLLVDGPMRNESLKSFLGYINIPYCHGMTIGELSLYFNTEYKIGCNLKVIKMKGWERSMSFKETGLLWIPTSPYIPEPDTPIFYASTGIVGALGLVNIGIGFTQPFKLIGAPWINAKEFADHLNKQKLPGVNFIPYYFRPFYGLYAKEDCQGVKIMITDKNSYRPLSVQYLILGILKSLYPEKVKAHLDTLSTAKKDTFCKVNGNQEILRLLSEEKYIAWKMILFEKEERAAFIKKREKYLLYP